jgi:predicted metal-dependent HD superfamily phosphohydrolase
MKAFKKELNQVAQYAKTFFQTYNREDLLYHNEEHTKSVVASATQIAHHYRLTDEEYFSIMAAAWFHDTGFYLNNNGSGHEAKSVELATAYLEERGIEKPIINAVKNCILATKMPQNPQNLPEQIMCDADLFHLGTDDFIKNYKTLRRETEVLKKTKISKHEWRNDTIQLMEMHQYHTAYCQKLLNTNKAHNLERLKNKALQYEEKQKSEALEKEAKADTMVELANTKNTDLTEAIRKKPEFVDPKSEITPPSVTTTFSIPTDDRTKDNDQPARVHFDTFSEKDKEEDADNDYLFFKKDKKKDKDKEEKKEKKPERGVETVFRVTSSNNQQLSAQADNKANIMITVNSIIISVLLSVLLGRIEEQPSLIIPTIILLIVNVATIIFAVLATRPNIPEGMFQESDIETKKVNLLFFGNFYRMNIEHYAKGMMTMMEDRDFLYGSLIQDVYNQGLVLAKKYHLLRVSYNIFMYGLIISVIAFVIAIVFFPTPAGIH